MPEPLPAGGYGFKRTCLKPKLPFVRSCVSRRFPVRFIPSFYNGVDGYLLNGRSQVHIDLKKEHPNFSGSFITLPAGNHKKGLRHVMVHNLDVHSNYEFRLGEMVQRDIEGRGTIMVPRVIRFGRTTISDTPVESEVVRPAELKILDEMNLAVLKKLRVELEQRARKKALPEADKQLLSRITDIEKHAERPVLKQLELGL